MKQPLGGGWAEGWGAMWQSLSTQHCGAPSGPGKCYFLRNANFIMVLLYLQQHAVKTCSTDMKNKEEGLDSLPAGCPFEQ
jgi:hypothetical protein